MPPPAAATHSLQLNAAQPGSIASAVTRPDSCVAGPVSVLGSRNWESWPATLGVTGPRLFQCSGVVSRAIAKARRVRNALRGAVWGRRLNALRSFRTRRSST